MRNYLALLFAIASLTACGGGGSGGGNPSGLEIPVGTVSGVTFDGLILNADVKIYDFSTGTKGALLAQATSDSTGRYSVFLKEESRPVLIEVSGGSYVEEAGSNANIVLTADHKLTAVANYTAGDALTVAVTTYSHLAAGLAAYQIRQGTAVVTAINTANTRVSSLVDMDILTTTPKTITNVANASATLTPSLRYGFLAGALSNWTYNHAPTGAVPHELPYTSIDFAQLLHDDIAADGLLDGIGTGSTPLSFGTTPLGVDVYRLGIGTDIVRIAASGNNKTGLDGAKVLSYAQTYIANTDTFFNAVPVVSFTAPTLTITSPTANAWARKVINVTATTTGPFGFQSADFFVDGVSVATLSNGASPAFSFNTASLADGPHSLMVRSTDVSGAVSQDTHTFRVDNTAPVASGTSWTGALIDPARHFLLIGHVSDAYSGVSYAVMPEDGGVSSPGGYVDPDTWMGDFFTLGAVFFYDNAGNCSIYTSQTNLGGGMTSYLLSSICP